MTHRSSSCLFVLVLFMASGCEGVDDALRAQATENTPAAKAQSDFAASRMHRIIDTEHGGLVLATFISPADWRAHGSVEWRYHSALLPAQVAFRAEAPDGSAWAEGFPTLGFSWLEPAYFNQVPIGQDPGFGPIYQPAMPIEAALLRYVIEPARGDRPGFRVLESRPVSHLAEAMGDEPTPGEAIAMRVTYRQEGRRVEEQFYALMNGTRASSYGAAGLIDQNNWFLSYVHSLGAVAGRLDAMRPELGRIVASLEVDSVWKRHLVQVSQQIQAEFDRLLAQGYAQIEAAGRISQQISANNDAMLGMIESQRRTQASGSTPTAASSTDSFRVETLEDSYWGESQQPYDYQYHWTDGFGNSRHSNDAGYNPNIGSSQNWELMEPAP
ncbi:MAG: hypothetical protein ACREVE_17180 [Gammaproteobacteria bacterium]